MSWSGGVYTRTNGVYTGATVWNSDDLAGITILSTRHDTHDQDLATGINACLTKDGSNSATANLNLGAFRYTNAGVATASTDLLRASQVIDGSILYAGTTGGTTTAYTLTPTIAITRTVGMVVRGKINATNTGTATLNVSGTGAANIVARTGSSVPTGALRINSYIDFMWDGTNWVVVNPVSSGWVDYTPSGTAASGTYTINTINIARWNYNYNTHSIDIQVRVLGTTSLTTASVSVSIPFTASEVGLVIPASSADGGSARSCVANLATTTTILFFTWDNSSFTAGASRNVFAQGTIKLA